MKENKKAGENGKIGDQLKKLNLTQTQKDQMRAFKQDGKTQKDAINNDASLTQDQKNQKLKDLKASQKAKMSGILTPEQKSQMKSMKGSGNGNKNFNRKGLKS
jgi:Spy/CpxP family protein refolding chaperone